MRDGRHRIQIFLVMLFVAVLAGAGTYSAIAQEDDPPDRCADSGDGNGQNGGQGGQGGGMTCGGGPGGGAPGATGEPSDAGNGAGGGGTGGNGSNGTVGGNNVWTPSPAPYRGSTTSSSTGSGTMPSGQAGASSAGTSDERLAAWSKQLSAPADEIATWFGALTADDSIAGVAKSIVVHPDDQVTIFAGDRVGADDARVLRTGIEKLGDASTKGGDTVEIGLHSTKVPLGSTVTEAGGRFSATVRVPPATEAGRHFIVALAPNNHQGRAAFVYPVTVAAREPVVPAAENVETTSGTPNRFPWMVVEFLVGTVLVVGLFVMRVRRASASGV